MRFSLAQIWMTQCALGHYYKTWATFQPWHPVTLHLPSQSLLSTWPRWSRSGPRHHFLESGTATTTSARKRLLWKCRGSCHSRRRRGGARLSLWIFDWV